MALRADQWNQLSGTIPAAGSLSTTVDLEGWSIAGLIVAGAGTAALVAGSVQFRVSVDGTTFYPLMDSTNTRVAYPHSTTGLAYSAVALQVINPYRYVRVEFSAAQTNGARVTLPVKLY